MNFNGDWEIMLQMPHIAQLNNENLFGRRRTGHLANLKLGMVPVKIEDEETDDPDPLPEQINAIEYVRQNENRILASLYENIQENIYPEYKSLMDEEEDWFPDLESVSDLKKTIGINQIQIDPLHKDGISYTTFSFEFSADDEHGLEILMHKDRMLDFGGTGSTDYRKIFEELGINYEEWLNEKRETEYKIHRPNPKYGKLKPWQENANEYFPFGLLHSDRFDDFRIFLSNNAEILQKDGKRLLEVAEMYSKKDFVKFLKANLK